MRPDSDESINSIEWVNRIWNHNCENVITKKIRKGNALFIFPLPVHVYVYVRIICLDNIWDVSAAMCSIAFFGISGMSVFAFLSCRLLNIPGCLHSPLGIFTATSTVYRLFFLFPLLFVIPYSTIEPSRLIWWLVDIEYSAANIFNILYTKMYIYTNCKPWNKLITLPLVLFDRLRLTNKLTFYTYNCFCWLIHQWEMKIFSFHFLILFSLFNISLILA